jgi:hypothetical protein
MSQTTFTPDLRRDLARSPDSRVLDGGPGTSNDVIVDATRPRQTEQPTTPFRDLLAGGVSVLMGGAAVATHVMGAPRLAAAITGAESRATAALGSPLPGALGNRVMTAATTPFGGGSPSPSPSTPTSAASAAAGLSGAGSDSSDLAAMQAMQRESQVFNMQLLGLQDQVQQDSQRFTTLSNVMRAKHDTAKAAVSNIRS